LADGSNVRLAPGSAVAFDDRGAERRVRLLRGTTWFDIVHDPRRPFRVATGGITTTVLGTAFEVRRDSGTGVDISVKRAPCAWHATSGRLMPIR
jgi:transmembrane sensor